MALFFSLDSLATFVFEKTSIKVPRTKKTKVEVVCFTGPIARVVIPKNKILPEELEWVLFFKRFGVFWNLISSLFCGLSLLVLVFEMFFRCFWSSSWNIFLVPTVFILMLLCCHILTQRTCFVKRDLIDHPSFYKTRAECIKVTCSGYRNS
ncbi:hypothetical protein C2G38_2050096 [Gigaspora rosea]|uniref:Uncharacterized protein n=1 Tax=Gigaspora rosea TaxID=44941 RepID=A0A397TWW3_9GLOM|nr:hypothetical protein C2G38_2050096 [Gigaspora rosea]